jgi:excisionase family DNA binding protein
VSGIKINETLASPTSKVIHPVSVKTYSTTHAARKLGVTRLTIQRHIAAGTITAPKLQRLGGVTVRIWTERDVQRVKKQLQKRQHLSR